MIFTQTNLNIADNSGANIAKCIKVLGLGSKKCGSIGDLVLITIKRKKKKFKRKIQKKTIYHGLIIMIKQQVIRKDGTVVKFNDNRLLLFSMNDLKSKFLGTRIYGSIMKEVKYYIYKNKTNKQRYFKIISYCDSII
jgi:large subunit ribosomal protein L14